MMTVEPFKIAVPDSAIADLHDRLRASRWPNEPAAAGWQFGSNLGYMRALAEHWLNRYDWRRLEERLNALDNYRVPLDGLDLHFVRASAGRADAVPVLLCHGWPSSFMEFLQIMPLLADPRAERCFDLVIPSLPGFGFSSAPPAPLDAGAIARIFHRLMTSVLGHEKYIAAGGDWGSLVASRLALDEPASLHGLYLTMVPLRPARGDDQPPLTEEETAFKKAMRAWWAEQEGYYRIQSTKPQSLAFGLTDSPIGLAAWLTEKFRTLCDTGGELESRFDKDQLLDMISLYWFTGTINSANWMYAAEAAARAGRLKPGERVSVPTGYADYPIDAAPRVPRSWAMRSYDVVHWSIMEKGGHFAALEEPELFAADFRRFASCLDRTGAT